MTDPAGLTPAKNSATVSDPEGQTPITILRFAHADRATLFAAKKASQERLSPRPELSC